MTKTQHLITEHPVQHDAYVLMDPKNPRRFAVGCVQCDRESEFHFDNEQAIAAKWAHVDFSAEMVRAWCESGGLLERDDDMYRYLGA
jgi:hypothetical protein